VPDAVARFLQSPDCATGFVVFTHTTGDHQFTRRGTNKLRVCYRRDEVYLVALGTPRAVRADASFVPSSSRDQVVAKLLTYQRRPQRDRRGCSHEICTAGVASAPQLQVQKRDELYGRNNADGTFPRGVFQKKTAGIRDSVRTALHAGEARGPSPMVDASSISGS
jgi:hypothetical protein